MRKCPSMLLIAFLLCWASYGFGAEGPTIKSATRASFPTRVLGSIAAIGDSITQAYDAEYSTFGSCLYMDNPEYSFCTNTTSNSTISIAERAIAYKGSGVATANFGSDGAKMTAGVDQALEAKTWALTQAEPRMITIFLGHNDICGGEKDKYNISCTRVSQDPNNYCRTSIFYYEQQMRQMLDVLVTIPSSQIAIIHPIRVSQICNFAKKKVVDEPWLTLRCEDLWVMPNLIGEDAVCPSLTSCSADRIADAYTTWVSYRDIANKVVEEYNLYAEGQTIPYNSTYSTGNVVRASSVSLQTTDAIGNLKFSTSGDTPLSVCECFHPSKYGQNLLANSLWEGIACSTTTPCCNDNVEGDSDYNKGLCNNYTTSGSMSGFWFTDEGKTLTVIKEGSGVGMVTSIPGSISCGTNCSEPYPRDTIVTLTATADSGSNFLGWSGEGCSGTGNCTVTMTADKSVTALFTYDDSSLFYADFAAYGLYQYDGNVWTQIDAVHPTNMIASGSKLYAAYSGYGLYAYDSTAWTRIDTTVPTNMAASGLKLYATYPGIGLYKYDGSAWSRIDTVEPLSMVASGPTLYAAFTGFGLYKYDGSIWTRIDTVEPARMAVSGSTLYTAYSGSGLYKYDGTTWTRIDTITPATMVASSTTLYAIYTGSGLYKYDGSTWTRIDTITPANMVASSTTLYAIYSGSGLYKYDGTAWTRIDTVEPASMAAGQ